MSTWLVTGGAGFIGSNFVRLATEETKARLIVLDSLTYAGRRENLEDLERCGAVEFVHGDICDAPLVQSLFKQYDFSRVFHLAAESHVDRSLIGAQDFLRTNIQGTYTLLESVRQAWSKRTEGRLFVHVSTDEVFGDLEGGLPATELTAYNPGNPYSASKAAADHLVRAWARSYDLPAVVTNCGNNYGPRQSPEKLIPLVILSVLENRDIPVYGDGRQVRDWIYVTDHCRGLLSVAEREAAGSTYLFAGNSAVTNLELVRLICDELDRQRGMEVGSSSRLIRHVPDRPGHDRRYALDSVRTIDALGWHPKTALETGLRETVRWYLDHRAWIERGLSAEFVVYYKQQYAERLKAARLTE